MVAAGSELAVNVIILVLRGVALLYEAITRPLYIGVSLMRSQPKKPSKTMAYSVTGLGEGPWRCVEVGSNEPLLQNVYADIDTVYESWQYAAKLHAKLPCCGQRRVIAELNETDKQTKKQVRKVKLGDYEWSTYAECASRIEQLGHALAQLTAVRPGSHVAFYCETRPEWMYLALAAWSQRAVIVTMYSTLSRDALDVALRESEPCCIVTTTELLNDTLLNLTLPSSVKHVVTVNEPRDAKTGAAVIQAVRVLSLSELLNSTVSSPESQPSANATDVAMIMYTSGTTGRAKGVVLTHANVLATVAAGMRRVGVALRPGATFLAYLPLAHVLELACELAALYSGCAVGFGSPQTLTRQSPRVYDCEGDLVALRPTLMPAVPIILERLAKGIREKLALRCDLQSLVTGSSNRDSHATTRNTPADSSHETHASFGTMLKGRLFEILIAQKIAAYECGAPTPVLDALLCRKLAASLGGRLELMMIGGAPLNRATQTLISALFRVQVAAAYGLTETTAGACMSHADLTIEQHGTVGPPLACCELLLRSWSEAGYMDDRLKSHVDHASSSTWLCPRGELLVAGPNVFLRYFANEGETQRAFVELNGKRWFTTGDIVEVLSDGTFRVVDRRKDCFKLANGEYIAPGRVEAALLASSLVESVCVVGNSTRNYLAVLIVPKRVALLKLARDLGLGFNVNDSMPNADADGEWERVCQHERVRKAVHDDLVRVGCKLGLPRIEMPARLHICTEVWSPENGLLTDSLKLRRRAIETYYRSVIELLYAVETI